MTDIVVRTGTPADVHNVMSCALAACEENGLTNPNPVKLLGDVWAALTMQDGIMGLIGNPGERVEAGILLRIGPMWYGDDKVLMERAIFVHPDFRASRGGRARLLCEYAKKVSNELGLPLHIGVMSNERTEAKIRLYERQFGKPAGAFFIYNGHTGNKEGEHGSGVISGQ